MLNLSPQSVDKVYPKENLESYQHGEKTRPPHRIRHWIVGLGILGLIFLFMPWTQNIQSNGYVTALRPDQRPQTLQSIIGGRIEKWYVQEGDTVRKGDTLLHLSEIKEAFFDTSLLLRTANQAAAAASKVQAYQSKVDALERQLKALQASRLNKLDQARNKLIQAKLKVESDSNDLIATQTQFQIAESQLDRSNSLFKEGLQPINELEARRQKAQDARAKRITAQNNLLKSRNEIINAEIEINSLDNDYQEKIAKVNSESFAAQSAYFEAESEFNKLSNQYANFHYRNGLYWVLAPQTGVITKSRKTGLGELVKEGEEIISISPIHPELAVELYVRPLDLPLLRKGNNVRFLFDGWPTLVFSGWPGLSVGSFGGVVTAIDAFSSDNGLFRVLVRPDPNDVAWPEALRVGSGAQGIALLNDVPIWYEMWRQLNGFPPDYYDIRQKNEDSKGPSVQNSKK